MASPQFGALSSPASQPAAFDFKGSDAVTLISTWSHLGHSNNRCSKPMGPEDTRSSIIRVWQREQRRRSMAIRNCWVEDTVLPLCWGGSVTELSVTDGCLWWAVIWRFWHTAKLRCWSILLTFQKLMIWGAAAPADHQRALSGRRRAGRGTSPCACQARGHHGAAL